MFVKSAKSIPEPFSSFISVQSWSNKEVRKIDRTASYQSVQYSKIQDTEAEGVKETKRVTFSVNIYLYKTNLILIFSLSCK